MSVPESLLQKLERLARLRRSNKLVIEIPLTDQARLQVVQEIWQHARDTGSSDGFRNLTSYEAKVKERRGG